MEIVDHVQMKKLMQMEVVDRCVDGEADGIGSQIDKLVKVVDGDYRWKLQIGKIIVMEIVHGDCRNTVGIDGEVDGDCTFKVYCRQR